MSTKPTGVPSVDKLFRLDGQVAVIAGGGNGIGRMTSHVLAQSGALVVVMDIDAAAADSVVQEITDLGGRVMARYLDVTDEAAVVTAFGAVVAEQGRLDVLVNCAGGGKQVPAVEMELDDWNEIVTRNLTSTFLCCREAGKQMLQQGSGSIINVSSILGHSGGGIHPNPAYHAGKGAVISYTRALAAEWGPQGVRVNDIAPTYVNTRLAATVLNDPKMRATIESLTPLGRVAEVADLAGALLYLASSASAMVTGHSLRVDGGYLAR